MERSAVISNVEKYVSRLLTEKLDGRYTYHHLQHTLAVRDASMALAERAQLSPEDCEVLELAALLHDCGYTEGYEEHEASGCRIAEKLLKKEGYPTERTALVLGCIEATKITNQPESLLEMLLRDADLSHLAAQDYLLAVESLRYEWKEFLGQEYSDREWHELNHGFIKSHSYYTHAARELWDAQKTANQKALKKLVKEKTETLDEGRVTGTRSAQMMFKTSLRNHIDLSNLADNKANIMLSINAIIITIAMPLAATYVREHLYLLAPMGTLLATCLTSMFFATLATRPIKMTGYTNREAVREGKANLFFFGNFFKMSFEEYREGMLHIVADESRLDSAIMRDLFFLGKSLGRKYTQLRTCYTVFVTGIGLTVMIFVVAYLLYGM
ncbi:MAG: HD domain-containing protein [Saprospiraceae bacterium]|nr:HD domain-containing protein [Saprospiraceae bacterium]